MRVCINLCLRVCVCIIVLRVDDVRYIYICFRLDPIGQLAGLVALGGCCCFKCHSDDNFLCPDWCRFSSYRVLELYFGGVTGGATASISHAISINERGGRERGTTRGITLFPGDIRDILLPGPVTSISSSFVLLSFLFFFFLFF